MVVIFEEVYLRELYENGQATEKKYRFQPQIVKKFTRIVDLMMEQGLLEEARQLYPYRELNSLNTVGYKELFDFFDGKLSLEQAVTDIKTHTRRYAKRQMTWFKRDGSYTQIEAGR